jgi:hypothetical protein
MIYLYLLHVICRGERIKEEWRTENGGITYVNECDGNDSTRCCGESTWIDMNTGSERGWNIIGDERPTPTGTNPIRKNMIHVHMNV